MSICALPQSRMTSFPYGSVWNRHQATWAAENPMPAAARTPRSSWTQESLRALAAGGPEAIRVEVLARALGVTKGGFYWHFDDRQALLEETLDGWERLGLDAVIDRV